MSTISPRGRGLILGRRSRTATDSYGTRSTGRSRVDHLLDRGLDPRDRNRTPPGLELERVDLPEHEAERAQEGGADRIEQDGAGRAQRAPDDAPAWVQEVAEVGDLHADQPPRVADHPATT